MAGRKISITISEHELPTYREGNGNLGTLTMIESHVPLVSSIVLNAEGASSLLEKTRAAVEILLPSRTSSKHRNRMKVTLLSLGQNLFPALYSTAYSYGLG